METPVLQDQPTQDNAPTAVPTTEKTVNDGVPHHKLGCGCKVCVRIRNAKLLGKPSRKELKLKAAANRKLREETKAGIKASLNTQVLLGQTPNAALAAKSVGVSDRVGQIVSHANQFVQTALVKAGITDDRLAEIAAAGMDAFFQKIITDNDGAIIDVINQPDWKSRHAFWRDILMVKKLLGNDTENAAGGSGGLVIITPDAARVQTGHPAACVCDECRVQWEEKARHLRVATIRDARILADSSPAIPSPATISSGSDEDEDEDNT
jgi:hypothetical protein